MKSSTAFDLPSEVIDVFRVRFVRMITLPQGAPASSKVEVPLTSALLFLADALAYHLSVAWRGMHPQVEPVDLVFGQFPTSFDCSHYSPMCNVLMSLSTRKGT